MGVVWRGRDVLLDRTVAVKEIIQPASDETYQRALREARAAARVKHPGVAAVYDVVSEDSRWYIVMELVEGRPLSAVIDSDGPLPPPVVADIGRQILAALEAGHAAGVLHRDLKPSNVLITPAGRAVLTDFGIASVAGDPSITRTGIVLGTPGYLAPERASGEAATIAADLWSLGATLYAAAEGHGPYDSYGEVMAMMVAVISSDPPLTTAPEPLAGIITALLSRDPRLRPGAAETARVLGQAFAAGSRAPAPAYTVLDPPTPAYAPAPTAYAGTVPGGTVPGGPGSGPGSGATRRLYGSPAAVSSLLQPGPVRTAPGRRGRGRMLPLAVTGVALAAVAAASGVLLTRHSSPPVTLAAALPAVPDQFRVAPVLAGGNPVLFARDRAGHLVTDHFANGASPGWTRVPSSPVITGEPAVTSTDGALVVLARSNTGFLQYLRESPGGSWSGPVQVGSQQVTSSPAVLQVGGLVEAFARLGNGQLGVAVLNSGTWSDWKRLGGSLAGPPVAALDMNGNPNVLVVSRFGALVDDVYVGGTWTGFHPLPGGNYTGVPAIGVNPDGRLEAYVRTTGGIVVNVWQQPRDIAHWGGPQNRITGVASDAAVTNESQNRIEVFALSTNTSVLHSWQNSPHAGTSWSEPARIGTSLTSIPAVLRIGTGGQEELFVRTLAGTIAVSVRDPGQGTWSSLIPIGGTF